MGCYLSECGGYLFYHSSGVNDYLIHIYIYKYNGRWNILHWSPLKYPLLIYVRQVTLSSNNTMKVSLIKNEWQVRQMCPITNINQTHSWLPSYSIKISKWLEEVATIMYLTDVPEMSIWARICWPTRILIKKYGTGPG